MNSDLISLSSLAISFFAIFWSIKTDWKLKKQSVELNQQHLLKNKKEEMDSKKAIIKAVAKNMRDCAKYSITISNVGIASAKNIRFDCGDICDIQKRESGILMNLDEKFPYPLLHAGDSFSLIAHMTNEYNPTPIITFTWDDDYQENNKREQVLDFD